MDFNSLDDLYTSLEKAMNEALIDMAENAKQSAYEYIQKYWYDVHHHNYYERLNLMTKSLTYKYTQMSDGASVDIYVIDEMHPASNSSPATYEYLYKWFEDGFGGEEDGNEGIMEHTQRLECDINSILKIFKDTLKRNGII